MSDALAFAPQRVEMQRRADGTLLLRSPQKLGAYARCVGEWLAHWARIAPEREFLRERAGADWRGVQYGETLETVRRIGQALLERGLNQESPVAILSENGIDHALLALGAMHAGVPVAPISPAYSLLSEDFARLRYIFDLIRPGLVWTADPEKYASALAAVGAQPASLDELLSTQASARIDETFDGIVPDTVAKILFTSGSTGLPKGVLNTQRMLCANQQMLAQAWPFIEARPPVVVDWLPWNHTFGGNHNFNLVLRNGGTLYIDAGRPVPGLVETTVRNLRDVSPTIYFNVPRGYDLLLPFLENDPELRRNFFRDLDALFYAAAALSGNLWDRIVKLAMQERDGRPAMLSGWGSTETAPLATSVHFPVSHPGVIGLPVAGCELKLVPTAGKFEVRVRGANVTPGYFGRPDLTEAAFDEEGFYRIGDAVNFADSADPSQGLVFDGRIAEDFKLSTGTWVHVGALRIKLIAAGNPLIQDAVIAGQNRDEVGALLFLNAAAVQAAGLDDAAVRERIRRALNKLGGKANGASSIVPRRALILSVAPSIDANEITDKGYINQRAVLENRAALVERLYSDDAEVILP